MEFVTIISFNETVTVILRTVIIFLFVFAVLRLLGKRHLSHLTYLDLLLLIALGSAVGDVMIYEEETARFIASLVAISVVAVLIKIFDELSVRYRTANSFLSGTARLIIDDGRVIKDALEKEDLSEDELMGLLRERGIASIKNIKKAYIEIDGELSFVLHRHKVGG